MLPLPPLYSAAWVLTLVILVQTLLLLAFVISREPRTLRQLWQKPRLTLAISGSSFLGSVGWFTAFSLASVAMVKTLGQIEVLIMLLISALWFKEKLQKRALSGLVLIVLAAIAVIWA
jgi:drug/metabolite transporter (DMT)-like permease